MAMERQLFASMTTITMARLERFRFGGYWRGGGRFRQLRLFEKSLGGGIRGGGGIKIPGQVGADVLHGGGMLGSHGRGVRLDGGFFRVSDGRRRGGDERLGEQ